MNLNPVFCCRLLLLPALFYCCVHPELLCKTSTRRVLQIFVTCFFRKKISQEIWVSLVYSDDIALFLDIWSFGITNIHIVFYKFSMLFFKVFGSLWVGRNQIFNPIYKGGKCIWCKTTGTIMFYYPENHRNDVTIKCIIQKNFQKT